MFPKKSNPLWNAVLKWGTTYLTFAIVFGVFRTQETYNGFTILFMAILIGPGKVLSLWERTLRAKRRPLRETVLPSGVVLFILLVGVFGILAFGERPFEIPKFSSVTGAIIGFVLLTLSKPLEIRLAAKLEKLNARYDARPIVSHDHVH